VAEGLGRRSIENVTSDGVREAAAAEVGSVAAHAEVGPCSHEQGDTALTHEQGYNGKERGSAGHEVGGSLQWS